jgi:hypothetical protein
MAPKAAKLPKAAERKSILDYFAELPDLRRDGLNKHYKLIDIVTISAPIPRSRVGSFIAHYVETGPQGLQWAPSVILAAIQDSQLQVHNSFPMIDHRVGES